MKVYTQHIGDPKKTKAKVVSRKVGGKKSFGVVTKDGPPDPLPRGVFRIEVRHRSEVSHAKKHHDGEDVLEEDEVEACAMEVCADVDVDVTGATPMAEAAQRMSSEKNKKGAKDKDASAKCDDDKSATSSGSDSSSDGSNSDADANDHDADAATDGEAPGDGSGKDSDDDVSVSVACLVRNNFVTCSMSVYLHQMHRQRVPT